MKTNENFNDDLLPILNVGRSDNYHYTQVILNINDIERTEANG